MLSQIKQRLKNIYGEKISEAYFEKFKDMLKRHKCHIRKGELWNEEDIFLITYGDTLLEKEVKPLQTLHNFAEKHLKEAFSIIHILPFFPYSSDDGFSVIDFKEVNQSLGDWQDIEKFRPQFRLMADLVANHISASSQWFKDFIEQKAPGKDYIYTVDGPFDVHNVVRPRSSALLTPIETKNGEKMVWTTFSPDQIDLNYTNPDLMMEMLEILLSYIDKGISVIRLDAIAFLWKRSGSSCLHEYETHEAVKLIRDVMDYCAPGSILLTETNVPHKENISYFGNGNDEAHMVYQFSLPPLLLHALHTGNSSYLTEWASSLDNYGDKTTFFNFTASHDGIGVRPLEGLLPDPEKEALFNMMKAFGGHISTRRTQEGTDVPYELNITYYDALKGSYKGEDQWQTERFIASQTVMMSLQGIPAVYIQSLLSSHNYIQGLAGTGQKRSINRRKWNIDEINAILANKTNIHAVIFDELIRLLCLRRQVKAFHPEATQEILSLGQNVFGFIRHYHPSNEKLWVFANISDQVIELQTPQIEGLFTDLIHQKDFDANSIELQPYQVVWLEPKQSSCF